MASKEARPFQIDRQVLYTTESDKAFMSEDYWIDMDNGVLSDDIGEIVDRRLRLALELADIVQALEFSSPSRGGWPGGIVAVMRSHGVMRGRPKQISEVHTDFPYDTNERLKKWLNENN